MGANRRDFLRDIAMLGILPGAFAGMGIGDMASAVQAAAHHSSPGVETGFDPKASAFWDKYANSFEVAVGRAKPLPSTDETEMGVEGPGRSPFLFHYGPAGLRAAPDISAKELPKYSDVNLRLNLERFHPSREDRARFADLKSAQLRIDVLQTNSALQWIDLMAWSAVAGLFPDRSGKLPPLSGLGFDPKTWQKMQNLVLPGGSGQLALNLAVVKKETWFMGFLQKVGQEVGPFTKVLGLPAISLSAFSAFTALYAKVQSTPKWVFRQGQPFPVYATQSAFQLAASGGEGIPFPPGNYVVVPQNYVPQVAPHISNLEVSQGYLVPKGTSVLQAATAAEDALPNVTYATLTAQVVPMKIGCPTSGKSA